MAMFQNLSATQKLQAAVHKDVRGICTEACHFLGLEITKPAIEVIAELVFKKCHVYGSDLEAFAKHAKRSTINADDVKLLVRRNPSLKSRLHSLSSNSGKDKRRKTVPVVKPDVSKESKESDVEDMVVDNIDLTFD
ncbi:centromere protein S [Pieris rapae]|uniref:centromere protein S n=1 Tax=Pieris rapae TaxID=64459 RepID=UPI000B92D7FB|nr:centromere protein S [Pieris rapae]